MEVRLDKRYPVAASVEQAWAVLADVRATAACMPGAQITEQLDSTHYKGSVKARVGPAVMSFSGDIEILALDAATRSMTMLGKGADKAGSSASMNLAARIEPGELDEAGEASASSVLVGVATIVVSGKLAQFGSRLLVPVSDAMLAQFADNFRAAAAAVQAPAAPDASPTIAPSPPATAPSTTQSTAPSPTPSFTPAFTASTASSPAPSTAPTSTPSATPLSPPRAPAPVKELNALALMWTVFKGWLTGLFSRRG